MNDERNIDEAFLNEMMKRGEKAWAGVKDVTAWVEELRNGTLDTSDKPTPRTDALMPNQGHKSTMFEHIEDMEAHSRQLERELNDAMAALRNLTHEIGRHEGASMMHPRLTRAITAATKLTTKTK